MCLSNEPKNKSPPTAEELQGAAFGKHCLKNSKFLHRSLGRGTSKLLESDKRLPCSLDFALGPYFDIKVFSHFSREDAGAGMENMTAPARLKPQDVASLPHRVLERFRELRKVTLLEDE